MITTDFQWMGFILTIIMAVWIWISVDEETFYIDRENARVIRIGTVNVKPGVIFKHIYLLILHLLVMFCISTVGGITDAQWITSVPIWSNCEGYTTIEYVLNVMASLLLYVLPMFLTFVVGYFVMGLVKFEWDYSHLIFFLTFVISVFGWCSYINDYNTNIEYTTEVTQETEERELVFFYEIPMQEVSGSISGSSKSISGEIFTVDTVPYVYLNENGNGEWDSAPAEDSEIIFITEAEKPKIVIVTNISKEIKTDHNDGSSSVTDESYWTQYYFYLPRNVIESFEE